MHAYAMAQDQEAVEVRSFLEVLKAPQASELTRKRKSDTNLSKGKRRARAESCIVSQRELACKTE